MYVCRFRHTHTCIHKTKASTACLFPFSAISHQNLRAQLLQFANCKAKHGHDAPTKVLCTFTVAYPFFFFFFFFLSFLSDFLFLSFLSYNFSFFTFFFACPLSQRWLPSPSLWLDLPTWPTLKEDSPHKTCTSSGNASEWCQGKAPLGPKGSRSA